jgi:alkylated DNA repair dioxygenase AlkB
MLHSQTNPPEDAKQPGYSYANNIKMKALSLKNFPMVRELSNRMEEIFSHDIAPTDNNDCFWNIGVNPVLYRGGSDHMGFHADDDQGETLILAVVITQEGDRVITFKPKGKGHLVEYQLQLKAGDAYAMDGMYCLYCLLLSPTFSFTSNSSHLF